MKATLTARDAFSDAPEIGSGEVDLLDHLGTVLPYPSPRSFPSRSLISTKTSTYLLFNKRVRWWEGVESPAPYSTLLPVCSCVQGIYGEVSTARVRGKVVAVKTLHTQDIDDDALAEFRKEVAILVYFELQVAPKIVNTCKM